MLAFILSSGPEDLRDPDAAFSGTQNARGIARKAGSGYAAALARRTGSEGERIAAHRVLVLAAEAGLCPQGLLGVAERGWAWHCPERG